ncbi:MAG TPA: carboxypeptidase-like regulatory domain-containing protein, partial [Deferrisomatales bacterium]|nr:carboxypeptidase-like regulatory domain-containing protein [Deferrisomatales bacterium]
AILGAGLLAGPGEAAIKVRKPVLLDDRPAVSAPAPSVSTPTRTREEGRSFYVGSVIFSRGNQIVAEIPDGARERERLILFDAGFRRRGTVVVLKPLEDRVYLLQTLGSLSAAPGDRLAPESELEAAVRVLGENRRESYQEFIALFPHSEHRPRMARELFRLAMKRSYPTFPGSAIEGRVRLAETVGRELSMGQVLVVLDRYLIARTDADGYFRIEGLPKLDETVELKLRVKDEKFRVAEETVVELAGGELVETQAELPLHITPTELVGQVIDSNGAPLAGVEVWTAPYSVEALTDETGSFRISRLKRLDAGGAAAEVDEPLFGGDFEVFAHRKGYSVNRSLVAAESFQENRVPAIQLARQDPRRQPIPELGLELRAYLEIDASFASQEGPAPKLNR